MCSTHWPKLIDLTRDEAKRGLRSLELEAYASIVTALRAQGDLTPEKKKVLQELQSTLSISLERHKAEVRRAVNDEKLTTIADHMSGSNVSSEWLIEGRRLVPLMPRLVPQTAFTATANAAANAQAEKNTSLPVPTQTGKDIYAPPPPTSSVTTPTQLKTSGRPQSPPSNVVHLPSGMSIHIKGEIKDEDTGGKTPSFIGPASDLVIVTKSSAVLGGAPVVSSETSSTPVPPPLMVVPTCMPSQSEAAGVPSSVSSPPTATQNQPMRVTVAKSPVKSQVPPLPIGGGPVTTGKVVVVSTVGNSNNSNIVSTSSATATQSTFLTQQPNTSQTSFQRPISGVRAVTLTTSMTTTSQTVHSRPFVTTVIPSGIVSTSAAMSNVVTQAAGGRQLASPAVSNIGNSGIEIIKTIPSAASLGSTVISSHPSPHVISTQRMTTTYPRTRTIITRPRAPYPHTPGQRSTIVIPAGSGGNHGNAGVAGQVIRTSGPRPAIHIKQEGSMKIITQAVPGSSGSKVLTKPTSTGSPVVVISTGSTSLPLATRVSSSGSKILNISSGATRVITASRQAGGNVVTVNPKSFHLTSVKANPANTAITSTGTKLTTTTGSKPNVIVVQKAGTHAQKKIMTAVSQHMGGAYTQTSTTPKPTGAIQVMTPTSQTQPAPPFSHTMSVPRTPPSGAIQSPFEKELVSFIQKQDSQNRQVLSQQQRIERRLAPKMELQHVHPTAKKITVVRQKADGSTTSQPIVIQSSAQQTGSKSSILAELISAVSHPNTQKPQAEGDVMLMEEQQAVQSITKQLDPNSASKDGALVQNKWVEMDAPLGQAGESGDSSAIKALLDLQQGHRVKVRRDSAKSVGYETSQRGGMQTPQSEIITIDQSGNIVQQVMGEESSGEIQYVPSGQRQIHIKQHGGEFLNEAGQPLRIEVSTEEELAQMENVVSQEIIGELDPNTGILYTNSPIQGQHIINTGEISSITPLSQTSAVSSLSQDMTASQQQHVITAGYPTQELVTMATPGDGDSQSQSSDVGDGQFKQEGEETTGGSFINTALDQADIGLHPYQYMQDNDPNSRPQETLTQRSHDIVIHEARSDGVHVSRPQEVMLQSRSQEGQSIQPSEVVVHGRRLSFSQGEDQQGEGVLRVIPPTDGGEGEFELEGVVDTESDGHSHQSVVQVVREAGDPGLQSQIPDVIADVIPSQHASADTLIQTQMIGSVPHQHAAAAVAVETTEGIDPTSLQLSELTSQNFEGEGSYSVEHALIQQQKELLESPPAGSSQESLSDSQNKRKRKPPPRPDELILQNQVSGWIRMALGLVHKVSKYRGVYKQKGELNAASWFTQPVNPTEVPDYYTIIQTPMDFSTIKKKLETNCYRDWSDFHCDVMLIRDNCYQYNEEHSEVRRDCDEVFAYYLAEYDKTLLKYKQSQMTSPTSKKPRLDRSPVRQQPM